MSREKKAAVIDELQEVLSGCSVGILTDYRGLSAPEITALRSRLRESDIKYRVVKNTLVRFAAERAGKGELMTYLEGPVAIAYSFGDVVEPAKVLTDYIRSSKVSLDIKGGFIGDRLLTSKDVMSLSTLPSREVLLAKVFGGMRAPISALVNQLSVPIRGIMGVLQARIQQLEGE